MNSKIPTLAVSLLAAGALAAASTFDSSSITPTQDMDSTAVYDREGNLARPRGYRSWTYVGAPLTPNDMNDGKAAFPEFHSVYIDPESYAAYKESGRWRDGTMLVKELVSVGGKVATSGKGYFMGEFLGLEVALKSAERFPREAGNWGYFRFTDEEGGPVHDKASALPASACAACHTATAADDSVFTQHYPVLRAAKGFGEGNPEDR